MSGTSALVLVLGVVALSGCGAAAYPQVRPRGVGSQQVAPGAVEEGLATYYSDRLGGRSTANGETYEPSLMTAAHRLLPFGTRVEVRREDTGRSVVVRVNDRGPYGSERRIIDLSRAAAEALSMLRAGVVRVRVEVLSVPSHATNRH